MTKNIPEKPTKNAQAFAKKRAKKFSGVAGKLGEFAVGAAALFGVGGNNMAVGGVFTGNNKSGTVSAYLTPQVVSDFGGAYQNSDTAIAALNSVHNVAKEVIGPFNEVLQEQGIDEIILLDSRKNGSMQADIGKMFGYEDTGTFLGQLQTDEGIKAFKTSGAAKAALAAEILKMLRDKYPKQAKAIADATWQKMRESKRFSKVNVKSLDDARFSDTDLNYPSEGMVRHAVDKWDWVKDHWPWSEKRGQNVASSAHKIVMIYQLQTYAEKSGDQKPYVVNFEGEGADRVLLNRAHQLLDTEKDVFPLSDDEVFAARSQQRESLNPNAPASTQKPKGKDKKKQNPYGPVKVTKNGLTPLKDHINVG